MKWIVEYEDAAAGMVRMTVEAATEEEARRVFDKETANWGSWNLYCRGET